MPEAKENEQPEVRTVFNLSEAEVEEIRTAAIQKAKTTVHTWRQKGGWLVCRSCSYPHAVWLGNDRMMVGEKNGEPIIEQVKISQN